MFSSSRWHGLTQPVPASLRECFFDFFEALNSGFLVTSQHVFKF